MTNTAAPSGSRSASSRAAAWAEVTTSVVVDVDAELAQVLGDRAGGREALLVT